MNLGIFVPEFQFNNRLVLPERINIDFKILIVVGQAIAIFTDLTAFGISLHQQAQILSLGQASLDFNTSEIADLSFDGFEINIVTALSSLAHTPLFIFSTPEIGLNDLDTAKTNTLVILKLAYIMNYQAEHDGAAFDASMDDFISWAAKLDGMSVYDRSGEIVGLYRGQRDTESKPKNQAAPQTAK